MTWHPPAAGLNQPVRNEVTGFSRGVDVIWPQAVCSVTSVHRLVPYTLQMCCLACAFKVHVFDSMTCISSPL